MPRTRFAPLLVLLAGLVAPADAAQEAGADAAQEAGADAGVANAEAMKLPVSFDRIKRRMAALEEREDGRDLLDLSYYVDVYARAPALDLLRNFDLDSETASYGSPTHTEMLEAMTPREWRPRAISTGNLFRWR